MLDAPRQPALVLSLLLGTALMSACDRDADPRRVSDELDGAMATTAIAAHDIRADADGADPDLRQPMGAPPDIMENEPLDLAITVSVKGRLAEDPQLSGLDIDVDTANGQVVLRGTAPDSATCTRATELTRAVDGVTAVSNELIVQARH